MSELTARARAVLDGVTEGPWEAVEDDDEMLSVGAGTFLSSPDDYVATDLIYSVDLSGIELDSEDYAQLQRDAAFVSAARKLFPELIEESERLEREIAALKAGVSKSASSARDASGQTRGEGP